MKIKDPTYSKLTEQERGAILDEYRRVCSMPFKTDFGHRCAITANAFCTPQQWNGKRGSDFYASIVTVLVFAGEVEVVEKKKERKVA